jgi:RNA polymerase sigma factor (sigma-70 family)
MSDLVQHLRRAVLERDEAGLSDGQLLKCYLDHRDEAAVAALVRRHGPMVWGVCRRMLGSHHDAEDAFQAAFLVLVRKAASVKQRERVGSWLYGVACQTARKAQATLARRRTREKQVASLPNVEAPGPAAGHDLQMVLDQELSRLPEKYRAAIVLCELQGRTRKEAAAQLGLPEGTVAGRLTRGRALLARRLARLGLAIAGGSLAAALPESSAAAGVPAEVLSSAIRTADLAAAGQAARGGIPPTVSILTEGVLKTMFWSKLKRVAVVVLLLSLAGAGSVLVAHLTAADREKKAASGGEGAAKSKGTSGERGGAVQKKLWAAMSVNHPLFRRGVNTSQLQFEFALVNESDEVIDPKLPGYPRLIVNGKELDLSSRPFAGPRDRRFQALPPGDSLQFGLAGEDDFCKPGIYRVYWQGEGYRSNEVVFRVIGNEPPQKKDARKMEGTWTIVNDDGFRKGEKWVIKDGRILEGEKDSLFRFYQVRPDRSPREIDITVMAQPDGQPLQVIEGIYSLQGDELKLCLPTTGKQRPAAFPQKPGPGEVIVLERHKP